MKPRFLALGLLVFITEWRSLLAYDCLFNPCSTRSLDMAHFQFFYEVYGGSARLSCPISTVQYWSLERRQGGSEVLSNISDTTSMLSVTNLNGSDEGIYRCHFQNSIMYAGCIFVLEPGMFARCSELNGDECNETGKPAMGIVGGTVLLDTSVVYSSSKGGPCNFGNFPLVASLKMVGKAENIFYCYIAASTMSITSRLYCNNSAPRTMMSLSSSNRNDVLNFNLTFRNLMLSDSGMYEYKVEFSTISGERKITKRFKIIVTEAIPTTPTMAPPEQTATSAPPSPTGLPVTNMMEVDSGGSNPEHLKEQPELSFPSKITPSNMGTAQDAIIGGAIAAVVIVIILAAIAMVVVIAVRTHCWISRRKGNISLRKEQMNANDFLQSDGLICDKRPRVDSKGRPISIIENFPDTLPEVRESSATDI